MKKLLLLSMILAFAAIVNAQTSEKKWGISASMGVYGTLNNGGIGLMPEGYFLGRYLNRRFDLVLQGDLGMFRSNYKINDLNLATGLLNLRYKLADESKNFRPYIYAGPGILSVNTGPDFFMNDGNVSILNFDAGLGGKLYVTPNKSFFMEAGYIHGMETMNSGTLERESYWKTTFGFVSAFHKTIDTDMDGVSDRKDKCPDTPTGVAVDENGCPVDTDGDGVADYIDECPTEAGITSLKGCPDRDKDGVADKDDACPDVFGSPNLKGCPDTDGDGVADKDDKCSDTPKGWKVDATGCPLDQDKDGVPDAEDDCPTVAGPKENKGCPVKVMSDTETKLQQMIAEPVYFDFDKANVRASEKSKIDSIVTAMEENIDYKINITGHADSVGPAQYNLGLSQRRINSVVKAITAKGIDKTRILSQTAMGETTPVAPNDTREGRKQNRRVEFETIKAE